MTYPHRSQFGITGPHRRPSSLRAHLAHSARFAGFVALAAAALVPWWLGVADLLEGLL